MRRTIDPIPAFTEWVGCFTVDGRLAIRYMISSSFSPCCACDRIPTTNFDVKKYAFFAPNQSVTNHQLASSVVDVVVTCVCLRLPLLSHPTSTLSTSIRDLQKQTTTASRAPGPGQSSLWTHHHQHCIRFRPKV